MENMRVLFTSEGRREVVEQLNRLGYDFRAKKKAFLNRSGDILVGDKDAFDILIHASCADAMEKILRRIH